MSASVRVHAADSVTGAPIANAHVGVFARWTDERVDLFEARTDEDGVARFAVDVPEGASCEISHIVRAAGREEWRSPDLHFPGWGRDDAEPAPAPTLRSGGALDLDAALEPGVTIAGLVTDAEGRPVRSARVELVLAEPDSCSWPYAFGMAGGVHWPPPCVTDADGGYEWLSFPIEVARYFECAHYVLTIEHDEHAPATVSRVESIPPDANGVTRCDVRLAKGIDFSGVVRGPSGTPVEAARVIAIAEPSIDQPGCIRFDKPSTSGADGRFTFRGLSPRRHRVEIEAPGFAPCSIEIDLAAARDAEPVVRLEAGTDLGGRLVDADGRAIAGADLWTAFGEPRAIRRTRSDAGGRFRFTGLPFAGEIEIRGPRLVASVRLPASDVTLRQPRPRDVRIRLVSEESGSPLSPPGFVSLLAPGWSTILEIEADGAVTVPGAIPGRYRLLANVPDRGPHEAGFQVLEDGAVTPDAIPVPRGGRLLGRVTDRTGVPVPDARVDARMWNPNATRSESTNADGRYEIASVAQRAFLVVTAVGFAVTWSESRDMGSPDAPAVADFLLERGAMVLGRVRRADGTPVARALVKIWIPGHEVLPFALPSALTNASGDYLLEHVPRGDYLVGTADGSRRVEAEDGLMIQADVVVP